MALSEHEQRLLEEMERNLLQHDTDVVAPGANRGLSYGTLALGVIIALVGLAVVIVGMVIRIPLLGVAGFAILVVGVLVAMRRTVPDEIDAADAGAPRATGGKPRTSFLSSIEDRWDRRRDDRDEG